MAGSLVLVVGPSGAGKDTLIAAARRVLANNPRFVFPKRDVTRPATATVEDHESVSANEFEKRRRAGAYALSWEAHGLGYGLPARIVGDIAAGKIVVCNGSRAIVEHAAEQFPRTRVLLIDAAPEVRAARLAGRGRESATEIAARLRREAPEAPAGAIPIDNSGPLERGTKAFIDALAAMARD